MAAGGHASTVTGLGSDGRSPGSSRGRGDGGAALGSPTGPRGRLRYGGHERPHPQPRHALPDPHERGAARVRCGSEVRLSGWVHRRRDHGQLIFLDLRDRHGLTQVVIDQTDAPIAHEQASRIRPEFVVMVRGQVATRLPGTENAKLPTGDIELHATEVEILSEAKTPPFYINEPDAPVDEALRLKYRYLDIRREPMLRRLLLRSRPWSRPSARSTIATASSRSRPRRSIKSTPEGARDFIVPSRLQPGTVYALPQSPQQLKQLLMVAGIDRYYQIARCYRDEDLARRPAARVHPARPGDELRR